MALYESIADYYDEIFLLKQTRLDFLESFLKNKLKILDIGCATGELAIALAKKGHQVTGIDLDEKMIRLARSKAEKQSLSFEPGGAPPFYVKDMTRIGEDFSGGTFDAVLCFGNTLVHLENPEKIKELFIGIKKILKGGGIAVLQIVNYDRVLSAKIKELPLLENENFVFRRRYDYDEERHRIGFITDLKIKKGGKVIKNSENLYPLTFKELKHALDWAGFSKKQFYGSETGAPYDKTSPALIAAVTFC